MSENELLSISKFSAFTGISRSTLRFYDAAGLFSPVVRGKNGYRYYSPRQIITVNLITVLQDLGVTLKEINKLTRTRTPESIMSLLTKQEESLNANIRRMQNSHKIVHTFLNTIKSGVAADEGSVAACMMPETTILLGLENDFGDSKHFYKGFLRYCDYVKAQGRSLYYPIGGFFQDMDAFVSEPARPTRFFTIDPDGCEKKPAGCYLVGYSRGYYGETGDLPERMAAYAREHSLVLRGPVYNIFILDEISVTDPDKYLLQVSASIEPPDAGSSHDAVSPPDADASQGVGSSQGFGSSQGAVSPSCAVSP
jgi:DNA-binding transcriptional MerR regulator